MKKIKNFRYVILMIVVVGLVFFVPQSNCMNFLLPKEKLDNIYLTLWHIDSFEGGQNSRKTFLSNLAIEFQKEHKNVYIIVKEMTEDGFKNALEKGESADIMSFGTGFSKELSGYLKEFEGTNNTLQQFLDVGSFGGKTYALPWCYSGYFTIGESGKIVYGKSKSSAPLTALYLSENFDRYDTYFLDECNLSTAEAFKKFACDKTSMLSICRDVIRYENYAERGILQPINIEPIPQYVDLFCMIGISKSIGEKEQSATQFIQFLMSESVQQKLTKLKLFSAVCDIYDSGTHYNYEKTRKEVEKSYAINVFSSDDKMNELNSLALKSIKGDINSFKEVEEILRSLV